MTTVNVTISTVPVTKVSCAAVTESVTAVGAYVMRAGRVTTVPAKTLPKPATIPRSPMARSVRATGSVFVESASALRQRTVALTAESTVTNVR